MAFAALKRARLRLGSNRLFGRGFEWGHRPCSRPIEVWGFDGDMVPAEGWLSLRSSELACGSVRTGCSVGGSNGGTGRDRGQSRSGASMGIWCRLRDSNPRPPDYKSGALPTELSRHENL